MLTITEKRLQLRESIHAEMTRFTALWKTDPSRAKEIAKSGEEFVELAKNGNFRKFCTTVNTLSTDLPMAYFATKALEASLLQKHLMIASAIIDAGYPINDMTFPNAMIVCLKGEGFTDNDCLMMVEFLANKKFDFNLQENKTWLSPLHYAVEKGYVETVRALLDRGVDVNIVADKDVMPLNLALAYSSERHDQIKTILIERGARESWRKSNNELYHAGFAVTESTSIAVKANPSSNVETAPKKNLVSFSGGGNSTATVPSDNKKMVKFSGGFNFADAPVPVQEASASISENSQDDSVVVAVSEDGCSLFSTGG